MTLDGSNVLNCSLRLFCSNYNEATVKGKLANNFLFPGFVLEQYIILWCANIFLTFFLLSFHSLFFADELYIYRRLEDLESTVINSRKY